MKLKLWMAISVIGILSTGWSQAARLSLVGAVTQANLKYTGTVVDTKAKMGYGGGVLAEFPLGKMVGLELGGIYAQRITEITTLKTEVTWIETPVVLRWWISPFISLNVGGYAAFGMGDIKQTAATGGSVTGTFNELGIKKMDYGAVGGLGFNFPLGNSVGLQIDGRYLMGLADLNKLDAATGVTKITYNEMQALVGLRFGANKGR